MKRRRKRHPRGESPQSIPLEEWIGGQNGGLLVSRKQLWDVIESYTKQRLIPLIAQCITAYDNERRQRVWWRRLLRMVKGLFLRAEQRAERAESYLDQLEAERETEADEPVEVEQQSPRPRSCVVCGSSTFRAVNDRGGLECEHGHVIEEPPAEVVPE